MVKCIRQVWDALWKIKSFKKIKQNNTKQSKAKNKTKRNLISCLSWPRRAGLLSLSTRLHCCTENQKKKINQKCACMFWCTGIVACCEKPCKCCYTVFTNNRKKGDQDRKTGIWMFSFSSKPGMLFWILRELFLKGDKND